MEAKFQINFENNHVLAVEDSLVQSKRIQRFFDEHAIPYQICQNGVEALESVKTKKPLLIISDIIMPVMDGYELCRHIKANEEFRDIPVILLTSLGDPLDIIKGLQAGADNFITKPYDDDYLMSRINYLVANRHIRRMGSGDMSIDIVFQNQTFKINSDKKQILDLLLSVYEAAVNRNEHLIQAQRQLEEINEHLKAANNELDAFARTVSHDLKSPLNGVIGFADLLKSTYSGVLDEDGKEYLEWITKSAHSMVNLIEDLLMFSHTARKEIERDYVDLSAMAIEAAGALLRTTYQGKYKVDIQEHMSTHADPRMMSVVLNNLIGNALKYSQNKATPEITIGMSRMNNQEVYYIRDNGAGFDMKKAEGLFQPFVRLHTNEEYQGTGVGLSTVKRIIERHGGTIWFDSAPGEGTVFYFTLD
jgi:two-component system sensor histidine kinase/response regulator